jgi:transcriptional regulator NrdR family protein
MPSHKMRGREAELVPYHFRLLCKRCNSYRFTTIELVTQQGTNLIKLECRHCDFRILLTEELFGNESTGGSNG